MGIENHPEEIPGKSSAKNEKNSYVAWLYKALFKFTKTVTWFSKVAHSVLGCNLDLYRGCYNFCEKAIFTDCHPGLDPCS